MAHPVLALITDRGLYRLFLGNTICAPTDNFALLMIGRALGGVGVAMFWTNAALAAAAMSHPDAKSLAVSRVLIGASIASVVGVPLGKAVSDAWRWEDALLLMAVLSALALAMVISRIHVPRIEKSQLQPTLAERMRAVCRPDILRAASRFRSSTSSHAELYPSNSCASDSIAETIKVYASPRSSRMR